MILLLSLVIQTSAELHKAMSYQPHSSITQLLCFLVGVGDNTNKGETLQQFYFSHFSVCELRQKRNLPRHKGERPKSCRKVTLAWFTPLEKVSHLICFYY